MQRSNGALKCNLGYHEARAGQSASKAIKGGRQTSSRLTKRRLAGKTQHTLQRFNGERPQVCSNIDLAASRIPIVPRINMNTTSGTYATS